MFLFINKKFKNRKFINIEDDIEDINMHLNKIKSFT